MENKIIPTAEEFIKQYNAHGLSCDCGCEWRTLSAIREYTKLHVQAALKAAHKNAKITSTGYPQYNAVVTRYSILNSYPLENIK
jgi:hypothetical protein